MVLEAFGAAAVEHLLTPELQIFLPPRGYLVASGQRQSNSSTTWRITTFYHGLCRLGASYELAALKQEQVTAGNTAASRIFTMFSLRNTSTALAFSNSYELQLFESPGAGPHAG